MGEKSRFRFSGSKRDGARQPRPVGSDESKLRVNGAEIDDLRAAESGTISPKAGASEEKKFLPYGGLTKEQWWEEASRAFEHVKDRVAQAHALFFSGTPSELGDGKTAEARPKDLSNVSTENTTEEPEGGHKQR